MNTHEQRSAIGAASAAISVAGIFALIALDSLSQTQMLALVLFSLSLPANLLFSLVQLNMAIENNPRNPVVITWSFWLGQSTLFAAVIFSILAVSAVAAACLFLSTLASLFGYGYASKTDGRKA